MEFDGTNNCKHNEIYLKMNKQAEEKLNRLLINCKIDPDHYEFSQWFLKQFNSDPENSCSLEEFAIYFLNTVRQYTEVHLKATCPETPKCQTPVRSLKTYDKEVAIPKRLSMSLSQQFVSAPNDNNFNIDQRKNNSFIEFESLSPSRISVSLDRLGFSPTVTRTSVKHNVPKSPQKLSTTQGSANKSASSSLCLGDFLVLNTSTHSRSHKKKTNQVFNQQSAQKSHTNKPKKRLQPISISKNVEKIDNPSSSIFAGESSFTDENNILKISDAELEDKEQCAILAARKSLALNASEIREVANASTPMVADTITTSTPVKEKTIEEISVDVNKIRDNLSLKRLAKIYILIIDLNLTTNILNELSFILNLFNASSANTLLSEAESCNEVDQSHLNANDSEEKGLSMLENFTNAICFALFCLEYGKHCLASLDEKSLRVALISERWSLSARTEMNLLEMYRRKLNLLAQQPFCNTSLCFETKACNNVHFQHEQDSKETFTSHQEFNNFRAQRDLFYKCLKIWESNNLNPSWKFSGEITAKINEIFFISENCINMAHLAKLFVSQLLLSASYASSPEEIGLDVDQNKFSKLTQRLIAPSQFSIDYQFPRTEAFFRDFILEARSIAFAEQLKMELYNRLTIQNDSPLDQINISKHEKNLDAFSLTIDCPLNNQFIVRPDILNSMLILAKFLGFTISLPYNNSNCNAMPAIVEKYQLKLRAAMQPTFEVSVLLEQAIEQSRLLIMIPWLVQYFAMLDNITLQLENYTRATKLLSALYLVLGVEISTAFCTTNLFIVKLCLGWLFESKELLAEQYYNYRTMIQGKTPRELPDELNFVKSKLTCNGCPKLVDGALNPCLEALLPIACPFLSEFRVAIMPAKYAQTKNASRTGCYRHITTRIAELPNSAPKNVQKSLIQAFLHSQNSSTRQIIKFCTERCYKSTVKDGQLQILLPSKNNADKLVNQITSFQYKFVYNSIKGIYDNAYAQVKAEWKECIPQILHKRINNALESLLPEETSLVLKRTYFMIIEKEAAIKISEWFYGNIIRDNYLCPNLSEMTQKICSANKNKLQLGRTQLTIVRETPSVSDLIDEMQYWLHCTSIRMDRFEDSKPLVQLLTNLIKSFENELPSFLFHLFGTGIVQLLQNVIAKHCSHLTDQLIEVACQVWSHPDMQKSLDSFSSSGICIYDPMITIAFLESLGTKTECFNQLGYLISAMIRKQVITVNYVNEIFVSIFKYEWSPAVLTEISHMLKSILKETSEVPQKSRNTNKTSDNGNNNEHDDADNEKSNLFMDMLADLSRDVDFF